MKNIKDNLEKDNNEEAIEEKPIEEKELIIHDYRIEALSINWKRARELYEKIHNQ